MFSFLIRCGVRLCHNTAPKEENKTAVQPGHSHNLELGFTNRSVSMTTEDSGYIPPVNQWQGYTQVVDYPDSIQSVSTFTTPANSTTAGYGSGYISPVNQWQGYTEVVDYPKSNQSLSTITTPADSTTAEYGSGYIRPRSPSHEYNYVLDHYRGSPN